jgi:hypothetical protein
MVATQLDSKLGLFCRRCVLLTGTVTLRSMGETMPIEAAGAAWAKAEYQVGIATGRIAVSAQLETIRGTAQRRFADVVAKLAAAVTPATDPLPSV